MKRATISLPEEVAELVETEARRRQTSFSEVVRAFIVEGLAGSPQKPRDIPWAGLFHDPDMVPGERVDDALAGQWADDIDRDRG